MKRGLIRKNGSGSAIRKRYVIIPDVNIVIQLNRLAQTPQQSNAIDCGVFAIGNMRRAVGISPDRLVTSANASNAREHFALDIAHSQINFGLPDVAIPTPPYTTGAHHRLLKLERIPGPEWEANSCWLDSSSHILSVSFALAPALWEACARTPGSVLGGLALQFEKQWGIVSDATSSNADLLTDRDAGRHLTELRDRFRSALMSGALPLAPPLPIEGTPFVSRFSSSPRHTVTLLLKVQIARRI